ncbi:hypothetical protein AMK59_1001 [Oryctes borbonicus]|uniref:Uncharacterized protein n=1 Tax=Oryctes borbonicus TaxID=1629725 RepID=A0A0T6B9U9_9SCAR|nr:hypothetical protein AMK59_1001 [Oryctes borbonicus]
MDRNNFPLCIFRELKSSRISAKGGSEKMCDYDEMIGHIEGMLNRDPRTTKTICSTSSSSCNSNSANGRTKSDHPQCHPRTAAECRGVSHVFPRKNKRFQQRRNSYAWNSLQRFKSTLIFSIYLISIFNLPRSLSMPVGEIMGDEWWINTTEKGNSSSSSKCNILKGMCDQARIARYHGTNFQSTSSDNLSVELDEFFPRLNENAKSSDELGSADFEAMNLNEFIVKIYGALQKYAVGLDAMLQYQKAKDPSNANVTEKDLKLQLRNLLFEINDYINAFDVSPERDVHRNDWAQYNMEMDTTKFKVYSSTLIKHYVHTLNYVYAGLNYYNQTDCN